MTSTFLTTITLKRQNCPLETRLLKMNSQYHISLFLVVKEQILKIKHKFKNFEQHLKKKKGG